MRDKIRKRANKVRLRVNPLSAIGFENCIDLLYTLRLHNFIVMLENLMYFPLHMHVHSKVIITKTNSVKITQWQKRNMNQCISITVYAFQMSPPTTTGLRFLGKSKSFWYTLRLKNHFKIHSQITKNNSRLSKKLFSIILWTLTLLTLILRLSFQIFYVNYFSFFIHACLKLTSCNHE